MSRSPIRFTAVGLLRAARQASFILLSGIALVATPTAVTVVQSAPMERPYPGDLYAAHIAEAAQRFGIPVAWIRAVMHAESAGDVRALSAAGAIGLMQIMPDTWAALRIRHRLGSDPYDPRDNILAGAAYLREMHDRYGSTGFLAAYNAGPGRYEEYLSSARPLPGETRAYVASLAPLIGGSELVATATVVAADAPSWTRAPLFVVRAKRTAAADSAPANEGSNAAQATSSVRNLSAIAPHSSGLFVAQNDQATSP